MLLPWALSHVVSLPTILMASWWHQYVMAKVCYRSVCFTWYHDVLYVLYERKRILRRAVITPQATPTATRTDHVLPNDPGLVRMC